MESKHIKRFIRKRLTEMETVILESVPVYYGSVDVKEDNLSADTFMISYENGFFVISFDYGADCTHVAAIMKKLVPRFELLVGEPYYLSGDGNMYWGDECREKCMGDLRKRFAIERETEPPTLHAMEKDEGLKN